MNYGLKAVLSNAQPRNTAGSRFPFPIPNKKYGCLAEMLEALGVGNALRQDCYVAELDR